VASGTALYGTQQSSFGQQAAVASRGPSLFGQVSLLATLPLFDPVIQANIEAAEAKVGIAHANLERVTLDARLDRELATARLRTARAVLDQAQQVEVFAHINLSTVESRYAAGVESPFSLIDAQREDRVARLAVVRARLAVDTAGVKLLAAEARADVLLRTR
jgi:outer membrane protein TolC